MSGCASEAPSAFVSSTGLPLPLHILDLAPNSYFNVTLCVSVV